MIENVGNCRDDVKKRVPSQVEGEERQRACVIFTDGSYIPEVGGGAAAAMEERTASHAYGPLEGISNYEMEAMAIMIAIVQFRQMISTDPDKFGALAIFSDSQAALDLLARPAQPKTLQYLSRFLRRSYNLIPKEYPLRLYWTPGHEGVTLNEAADAAAKEAADGNKDPVMLPVSLGGLLRHSRAVFNRREVVPISPYKTKSRKIAEALQRLEKGQAAAIFQLRCGHCPLRKYLHRIGAEDHNKCTSCFATETPTHFLIYCRRFTLQRRAFRKTLKEDGIKTNTNSATALLNNPAVFPHLAQYIHDTGRFLHLKSYIDVESHTT